MLSAYIQNVNHMCSVNKIHHATNIHYLQFLKSMNEIEEYTDTVGIDNNINDKFDNIYSQWASKKTLNIKLPIYVNLLNIILNTGIIPDKWIIGIKSRYIYKRKYDLPENNRPIALLSLFGTLCTLLIYHRLNKYSESEEVIHETQAGFRKSISTANYIFFILKGLMQDEKNTKNNVLLFYSF